MTQRRVRIPVAGPGQVHPSERDGHMLAAGEVFEAEAIRSLGHPAHVVDGAVQLPLSMSSGHERHNGSHDAELHVKTRSQKPFNRGWRRPPPGGLAGRHRYEDGAENLLAVLAQSHDPCSGRGPGGGPQLDGKAGKLHQPSRAPLEGDDAAQRAANRIVEQPGDDTGPVDLVDRFDRNTRSRQLRDPRGGPLGPEGVLQDFLGGLPLVRLGPQGGGVGDSPSAPATSPNRVQVGASGMATANDAPSPRLVDAVAAP